MPRSSSKDKEYIMPLELCGSLSFGSNKPGVFLRLCEVYRDLVFDLVDVDSHVRKGWFAKLLIARNRNEGPVPVKTLTQRLRRISNELGFTTEFFSLESNADISPLQANVVIVLRCENRVGVLSNLLEVLSRHQIDVVDIEASVDERANVVGLLIEIFIPTSQDTFYDSITQIRNDLRSLGEKLELNSYSSMVHSKETFKYLQEIDFEQE